MITKGARGVVLIHGLGRSPLSMRPIERRLAAHGYAVLNLGYPSRSADIPSLAAGIARDIAGWRPGDTMDFVTHSLGGVLIRHAVASGALSVERIHRVVMLGPPNSGSELADRLPRWPVVGPLYRRLTGPAGAQLGTDDQSAPAQLPAVTFDVGVIAGTRSYNPIFSALLGASNDGKVRVDRTPVTGMRDFLEVPYWHPFLMTPTPVHDAILAFLETGRFRHSTLIIATTKDL
jgi:pimeloyl-ACP methyl ester carboxylesterase